MKKVLALVALVWLLLMPPLFTDGECTRQFEEEEARIAADAGALRGSKAFYSLPIPGVATLHWAR